MKKGIKFSSHAKEKTQSRGVKVSEVTAAIKRPECLYSDVEHGTLVAIKQFGDNTIIVVYRMEDDRAKVITVFYTSKFDRLIRGKMARGAWKREE